MRRTLVRWLIHAVSLGIAARLVDGVDFVGAPPTVASVALVSAVFGLLHAFVKPALQLMACGLYLATLGLIHFVINALVLWATGALLPQWLVVAGFWPALQGALVASVVGTALTWLLDPPQRVEVRTHHVGPTRRWRGGDVVDGEVIEGEVIVRSSVDDSGDGVRGLLEDRSRRPDDP